MIILSFPLLAGGHTSPQGMSGWLRSQTLYQAAPSPSLNTLGMYLEQRLSPAAAVCLKALQHYKYPTVEEAR